MRADFALSGVVVGEPFWLLPNGSVASCKAFSKGRSLLGRCTELVYRLRIAACLRLHDDDVVAEATATAHSMLEQIGVEPDLADALELRQAEARLAPKDAAPADLSPPTGEISYVIDRPSSRVEWRHVSNRRSRGSGWNDSTSQEGDPC